MDRLKILNIWVDAVNRDTARKTVGHYLQHARRPHVIFASNPEKNFSVPKDPRLLNTFRSADLLLPDGIGMVWAAKILFGKNLERVPGSEFVFDVCQLAVEQGCGVFVYGATEASNKAAVESLQKRFKGLKIAGRCNGYNSGEEMPTLIDRINESRAEVLLLALGSPKQENWFSRYHRELKFVKVCQCVGGTLDTIAGNVKRAPQIWQKHSLEWLYRLITQPSRIKRQKVLPLFVLGVIKQKIFL